MYSNNTEVLSNQEKMFRDVLSNAVESLKWRLDNYDAWTDPLGRERLTLLLEVVKQEHHKVIMGNGDDYADLGGPIKAATEWGEPANSVLMRALREVERMFHRRHWAERFASH
jgi:hypothetical protein